MISFKRAQSDLKAMIDELCVQLTISHRTAKQKEDALQSTIVSLHADLGVQNTKSSTSFVNPDLSMPNYFLVIYVHQWVSRKQSKSSTQILLIPSRESR